MSEKIVIRDAKDALRLLDNPSVTLDDLDFSQLLGTSFRLIGNDFHSSITPPVMRDLTELQQSIYRAYALVKNGNSNIKNLTDDEKKSLEIVVGVGNGSSLLDVINSPDIIAAFKLAVEKMDGTQTFVTVAIIAAIVALYIGKLGLSVWTQYQIENKRIDTARFSDAEWTKRMGILQGMSAENTVLKKIINEGNNAQSSALSTALTADSIELDGVIMASSTAEKILEKGKEKTTETRMDGVYRVASISALQEDAFNIRLLPPNGAKAFSAAIDNLVFDIYMPVIQRAFFDRQPIHLEINCVIKCDTVITARIVSAKEVVVASMDKKE